MKIIHFADFHLAIDSYGPMDPETHLNGRVMDFLYSFDTLIDFAVDEDVDIAIFAGDAFHKPSPDPTLLGLFGERIVRLSEQCPVVLVVGNHDASGNADKASALDVFATLRTPNVYVCWDYITHNI